MFNFKFLKTIKEVMNPKANLLTFAQGQREANDEYIKSHKNKN